MLKRYTSLIQLENIQNGLNLFLISIMNISVYMCEYI